MAERRILQPAASWRQSRGIKTLRLPARDFPTYQHPHNVPISNPSPPISRTMGNQALDANPPNADYHLSTNGSNWLWAVFSLFAVSLFAITAWTLVVRRLRTHPN